MIMGNWLRAFSFVWLLTLASQLEAQQIPTSGKTDALVKSVTEAFFDLMPKGDFNSERAFMADHFANMMPLEKWKSGREKIIDMVGVETRYTPHRLTYYQQKHLLAAVDYSGKTQQQDTYVCGYILWEIPQENVIGFTRLEQNVVVAKNVRGMELSEAIQLLTNWYCPVSVIEKVLDITLQK